jgi:hypothetical protein
LLGYAWRDVRGFDAELRRDGVADNSIRWHHDLISIILRYTVRTLGWVDENVAARTNRADQADRNVHRAHGDRPPCPLSGCPPRPRESEVVRLLR